jgi:hypothetical protein
MKQSKGFVASLLIKLVVSPLFCFVFLAVTYGQNTIYSNPLLISTDPDMISTMAACALDKNGCLHIVFVGWYYEAGAPDDVASEIFYTNNLGGVFMEPVKLPKAEIPFPPSFEDDFYYSKEPTIAVDLNGKVHVAYYRTETQLNGSSWICYTNNKNGNFSVPEILYYNPLVSNSEYYSYGYGIMLAADTDNDSIHIVFDGNIGTGHGGARYSTGLDGNFKVPRTITQRSGKPKIRLDNEGIPNLVYWINSDTTNSTSNVNLVTSKILGGKFSPPAILFQSNTWTMMESAFTFDQFDSAHIVFRYLPGGAGAVQLHYIKGKPGHYTPAVQLPANTSVSLMYSIEVGKNQIEYVAYKQASSFQSLGFMYNDGGGFKDISPSDYMKYAITSAGPQWFALDKEKNLGYSVYTTGQIYLVTVNLNKPSAPVCINVPNHATNISITPTFSWYESARALKYHLQVSTTPDFSNIVKNENSITGTSLVLSGLFYNTTYYWRINANGAGGASDWSENWSFTTSVSAGISEQIFGEIIRIYPVPVDGILKIDGIDKENTTVSILSQEGNLLKQIKGKGIKEIDVSELLKGVYLVKISNSQTVINKKVVKL